MKTEHVKDEFVIVVFQKKRNFFKNEFLYTDRIFSLMSQEWTILF
jgi:hypothetical protein